MKELMARSCSSRAFPSNNKQPRRTNRRPPPSSSASTAENIARHPRHHPRAEHNKEPPPRPVANGVPAGLYRSVLIAIDLSDISPTVAQTAEHLGLLKQSQTIAVHLIEDERGPLTRATLSVDDRLVKEEKRASEELTLPSQGAPLMTELLFECCLPEVWGAHPRSGSPAFHDGSFAGRPRRIPEDCSRN